MTDKDVKDESINNGRPKKATKWKFAIQERNIRKKKCNSNAIHYTAARKIRKSL